MAAERSSLIRSKENLCTLLGRDLLDALKNHHVEELMLNPSGVLYAKRPDGKSEQILRLDSDRANVIIRTLATVNGVEISKDHPVLEGEIDFLNCRVTALIPPVVSSPVFCLRVMHALNLTFDDLKGSGFFDECTQKVLEKLIKDRRNLLVCGQTGCGKTSFLNAIINYIQKVFPHERIVTIEDTPELRPLSSNSVALYAKCDVSMADLVRSSLRLTPDRIIVGEVRGTEALSMVDAMSTGHDGCLCTMHAGNSRQCLERLKLMIGRDDTSIKQLDDLIALCIDAVLVLKREPYRHLYEIALVKGIKNGEFLLDITRNNLYV
ncbi:MAG: ATPase, T2SS/T4P/T4SS family [Succinivibrio sp.]